MSTAFVVTLGDVAVTWNFVVGAPVVIDAVVVIVCVVVVVGRDVVVVVVIVVGGAVGANVTGATVVGGGCNKTENTGRKGDLSGYTSSYYQYLIDMCKYVQLN